MKMLRFTKFRVNRLANQRELYSHFAYNNWKQLDTEKKWEYLQELENYFATEQGRPAVKILLDSSKNLDGNYGEYVPEENVIYINRDLVEYGTLIGPVDEQHPERLDANMQLFDTVAHEGYHAYQNYAIKHPGFHGDEKQVAEWAINDVKFFEEGDEYWVQPQERDAWKYGSEKTKEAFDEIEKYYGAEPGRKSYEKTVADSSYDKALKRLQVKNPDGLNQMYREMQAAYEEQYQKNSTFNPDLVTLEQYDKTLRDQVNRYYEHLKNNPSLSREDVMRMTSEMSEKYLASVEEYKNVQKQEEESEIRNRKEGKLENEDNEKIEKEAESEEQDNIEDLTDGKDYEEDQAENEDNAEDLSSAENFAENEEEENNVEENEETEKEAESEEEDNAEDLTDGKDNEEDQSESKDNAEDLADEKDNEEEQSENEDNAEDLSSAENFAKNEEEEENNVEENEETEKKAESEEQDNAEDLTDGKDNAEEKSESEDNAEDLTDEKDNAEEKSESEDNAEDLSSGEDSSTRYDGGDNDEEENESYSY